MDKSTRNIKSSLRDAAWLLVIVAGVASMYHVARLIGCIMIAMSETFDIPL